MDKSTYSFKSCIRGYHEYKDIWDAAIGEVLDCEVGLIPLCDTVQDQQMAKTKAKTMFGHVFKPNYLVFCQ